MLQLYSTAQCMFGVTLGAPRFTVSHCNTIALSYRHLHFHVTKSSIYDRQTLTVRSSTFDVGVRYSNVSIPTLLYPAVKFGHIERRRLHGRQSGRRCVIYSFLFYFIICYEHAHAYACHAPSVKSYITTTTQLAFFLFFADNST
jgi:hypothetical protein